MSRLFTRFKIIILSKSNKEKRKRHTAQLETELGFNESPNENNANELPKETPIETIRISM